MAAIVIAIAGIGLTNVVGWLKSGETFNPRNVATSVLIGFPASILFVATELQAMSAVDAAGLTGLIIIVGLLAQVAGFDTLVKAVPKIAAKRK